MGPSIFSWMERKIAHLQCKILLKIEPYLVLVMDIFMH